MKLRRKRERPTDLGELTKRDAGVWERGGRLFVETHGHPPRDGELTMGQPRFFREVSGDASAEEIGASVLNALEANYVDPELDDPTDILDTVYAAGLKSYGTFTRGAKKVSVRLEDNLVQIGPLDGTQHAGAYVGIGEKVHAASLSPEDLGRAVLEALETSVARPS